MITEDYIGFETAKLLKERGFKSDNCHTAYDENGSFFWYGDYSKDRKGIMDAPTLQMAMKWLREEKEVFITIGFCDYPALQKSEWIPEISTHDSVFPEPSDIAYDTYEQAAEEAIRYCLENLI